MSSLEEAGYPLDFILRIHRSYLVNRFAVESIRGNAIFIPEGMTREFRNDRDEPAEFILLMFGEGA